MKNAAAIVGLLMFLGIVDGFWASSSADSKVIVVVDCDYAPYMSGTLDQAKGLYPILIKAIFLRMGVPVDIKPLPWKRALNEGENGRAAIGGIYKNNDRLRLYDYSDPLFEECLSVFVKKGNEFAFSQPSDLRRKVIGLNRGWSYGEEFDSARKAFDLIVEEADSNYFNFKKLVAGRIDCLIADQIAARRIIQLNDLTDKVTMLDQPVVINQAYLAFANKLHQRELIERINLEIAQMKEDGSYQRTIQDFLASQP